MFSNRACIHDRSVLVYMHVASCSPDCVAGGPNDRQHLESEIRKAHVICVVYSIDNPNSFDRIPTYWLPYFRQLGVNVSLPCEPIDVI